MHNETEITRWPCCTLHCRRHEIHPRPNHVKIIMETCWPLPARASIYPEGNIYAVKWKFDHVLSQTTQTSQPAKTTSVARLMDYGAVDVQPLDGHLIMKALPPSQTIFIPKQTQTIIPQTNYSAQTSPTNACMRIRSQASDEVCTVC